MALVAATVALPSAAARAELTPEQEASVAAESFLDRYVTDDGRVVRTDQGGDTVSEGQAYGMLIAAAVSDEDRFNLIWNWTEAHIQRSDALLAWHWANGQVVDSSPATDADLVAASALALASERFSDGALLQDAKRIASAVLAKETVTTDTGLALVAGPWAGDERVVNPSYLMPNAMSRLLWASGDRRWIGVAATSRTMLETLMTSWPHLPPDWASVGQAASSATAEASPANGDSPRYSYDAVRVFVQLAVDCNTRGPTLAAKAWPFFDTYYPDDIVATYTLSGQPMTEDQNPAALVAAAASAAAKRDGAKAAGLLDAATELDDNWPTYYGSAWLALGRLWLDTSRLGGCRSWA